jgi:raffinose/stachyose/melibiose transport system permease protein
MTDKSQAAGGVVSYLAAADRSRLNSDRIRKYLSLIGLLALLMVMLFPFALVTINSFKTEAEYSTHGPLTLPEGLYTAGVIDYWNRVHFDNKLVNSTVISLSVAIFGVVLSLLNAFALGIGRVKGRIWFLVFFMIAIMLPQEALAYPLYYFAKLLKIYDTQFSVILVFSVLQSAFGTYLLSSVFSEFPREIIESAWIDGCSKLQLLLRIVVPISMPSLMVLFTFFFIWTWNEFFLPLILLISDAKQTVPIAVALNQSQYQMTVTVQSASALLGVLPCVVFFVIFQRTLTRGITAGAIK